MSRLRTLLLSTVLDGLVLAPAPFIALFAIRQFRAGEDFYAGLLAIFAVDYVVTFALKREAWRRSRR